MLPNPPTCMRDIRPTPPNTTVYAQSPTGETMDSAGIAILKQQHKEEIAKIREEFEKKVRDRDEIIETKNAEIEELKKQIAATATRSVEQPVLEENNGNVNRKTVKRTHPSRVSSSIAPDTSDATPSTSDAIVSSPTMSPQKKKKKTAAQTKKSAVKSEASLDFAQRSKLNSTPSTPPPLTETSPVRQGITSFLRSNPVNQYDSPSSSTENLSKTRKNVLQPSTSSNSVSLSLPSTSSRAIKTKPTSSRSKNGSRKTEDNLETRTPSGVACSICKQGDLGYHVSNLVCAELTECRIRSGENYVMCGKNMSTVLCPPCFVKRKLKRCKKLTNRSDEKEVMLQCGTCKKHFHKVCALFLEDSNNYECSDCQVPPTRRSVEDIPTTNLSRFMEHDTNVILWGSDEEKNENHVFVRTMNLSEVKEEMEEQIPEEYRQQFKSLCGDEFIFNARTIGAFQKIDGEDVLFFVMFTQEYENLYERNWAIIDYLDTVPLCKGVEKKGRIFGTLLNSYLAYMGSIGFTRAHFWARPPKQGDDYIFHVHPETQEYRDQFGLRGYYVKSLDNGKEAGKIVDYHASEAEYNPEEIEQPTQLHAFKDSIWTFMIDWAKWAVNEKRSKKQQTKPVPHAAFMTELRKLMEEHSKDNFYIQLIKKNDEVLSDDKLEHEVMWDRELFLLECKKNHWEWFDLRSAKYSTAAVIDLYFKRMKKKTT